MLKAASDVRFIGHEGDGDRATLLRFELPTFGTVAGEMFRQPSLWDDGPTPDETALDLFGAALNDVGNRRAESSRFDPGLLRRIRSYRHVLARGIDRILIGGAIPARRGQVDPDVMDAASELFAATPSPRRLRVTGRLDVMGASQGVLKLDVRPGQTVTALWEGQEPIESLRELFNRDVVLEGLGVFRPSGSLLRIDADAVRSSSPADEFFRQVPAASAVREYQKVARLKAGERSAYAELLGTLPAEESDEEFEAALAALR